MPIRPFPHPLRVGSDICHVPRIVKIITNGVDGPNPPRSPVPLNRFLARIFTPEERAMYAKRWNSSKDNMSRHATLQIARHLAGRWAAKEAVIKAVKPRRVTMQDIIVFDRSPAHRDDPNAPYKEPYAVVYDPSPPSEASEETSEHGLSAQRTPHRSFDLADGQTVRVSISHDGDYAYAVCIAPTMPEPGDVGGEAAAREGEQL
ncbi:hypothetical protein AOQ84DRAFT_441436 [Glonium stellatum]|uniref:4'-phosphopantetheinyl transferase domain-containing protein n=1 Tax=Glonium stellatum TaxID=574774 RepID=A0A8E2EVL9_9PEZI|nr:hypothetical protein AOQ84DRAFT_441436 [Glonium stellatum]